MFSYKEIKPDNHSRYKNFMNQSTRSWRQSAGRRVGQKVTVRRVPEIQTESFTGLNEKHPVLPP